jgi:hypothetical protein
LTFIISPFAVLDAGTSTSTPSHQHFRYASISINSSFCLSAE